MKSFGTALARVREMSQDQRDLLLAAGLVLGSAIEIGLQLDHSRRPLVTLATTLALCAAVGIRRRQPVTLAAAGIICIILFERLGRVSDWMLPSIGLLVLMYTVGTQMRGGRGILAAGGLVLMVVAGVGLDPKSGDQPVLDFIASVVMFSLAPMAVGRALASRRALTAQLRRKAQDLEREREDRARQAASAERIRIARELHDVIAHSVSVMVIQTQAARRMARTDQDQARSALSAVETAGRDALSEMRRMVGVLHRGAGEPDVLETPGLGQLGALAARARAAGLAVELHIEGEPQSLAPGVDLAAYRVVQEALTNVVKHAGPARVTVRVSYGCDELGLEISDNGRSRAPVNTANGTGHGLIGMRERLGLYGGELTAEPQAQGGFRVRARIPLVGVPA